MQQATKLYGLKKKLYGFKKRLFYLCIPIFVAGLAQHLLSTTNSTNTDRAMHNLMKSVYIGKIVTEDGVKYVASDAVLDCFKKSLNHHDGLLYRVRIRTCSDLNGKQFEMANGNCDESLSRLIPLLVLEHCLQFCTSNPDSLTHSSDLPLH